MAIGTVASLHAQRQMTRTGHIWFISETPLETIEAHNNQVTSILDTEKGDIVFQALMKGFQFEKALMQEHFNEKYVESDKYPKATFKGSIINLDEIDFDKDGSYMAKAKGSLTVHGVVYEIEVNPVIKIEDGKILATAEFPVTVADYEIKIPSVVRDNIAKEVKVFVDVKYEAMGGSTN
ncbi:MAG: YceI family protein [Bacteroidetes bacterium]|nr:YceI family protein [Bacteroidota bacterium]